MGAVITVLPVGFLPFVPEQALAHYFAHAVYATSQLPLLAVSTNVLRVRIVAAEAPTLGQTDTQLTTKQGRFNSSRLSCNRTIPLDGLSGLVTD